MGSKTFIVVNGIALGYIATDNTAPLRAAPQRNGILLAKVAVARLLHQSGVTSVITGARNPGQIKQVTQAAGLELSPEIMNELAEATDEVKRKLGSNPDVWRSESRFR